MRDGPDLDELERRLGYAFVDRSRLLAALTHRSAAHEIGLEEDYERLEFLGDAVLGLVAAERVFRELPDEPEGELTRLKSGFVSATALLGYAGDLGLGEFLILGQGEERSGGRRKESLLADSMEAVFGAIYLDGGLAAAAPVVTACLDHLAARGNGVDERDAKSTLQEHLQAVGHQCPSTVSSRRAAPITPRASPSRRWWKGGWRVWGAAEPRRQPSERPRPPRCAMESGKRHTIAAHECSRDSCRCGVHLASHAGEVVGVRGWVDKKRSSGKIAFLQVRDGSGVVQVVASRSDVGEASWEEVQRASQESVVSVQGIVNEDSRAPGGVEIHGRSLVVVSAAEEYPITPKEHGVGFLMEHRHLWLRSSQQRAALKVRAEVCQAIRDFFYERDFTLIDSPILTPAACEGTSTLFETDYFGDPGLSQPVRPALPRTRRSRPRQGLLLRSHLPGREVEDPAPPDGVLDGRARGRLHGVRRALRPGRGVHLRAGRSGFWSAVATELARCSSATLRSSSG